MLTEHSWPIQEMSLTVSGSKVVGPTQENATTLGRRRTDVGQALRGLTPAPTAGLWLIPLCPGLFQSLISWPGASPSQPRDIPQREHAGEASGVSGARGAAQRAVPPHTAQASPGGTSDARPCQGHVTGVPTSPGTEASVLQTRARGDLSLGGLDLSPLTGPVLTSVCPPRPTEHRPAP